MINGSKDDQMDATIWQYRRQHENLPSYLRRRGKVAGALAGSACRGSSSGCSDGGAVLGAGTTDTVEENDLILNVSQGQTENVGDLVRGHLQLRGHVANLLRDGSEQRRLLQSRRRRGFPGVLALGAARIVEKVGIQILSR